MLLINMYNILLERSFYSASAHVCCIKGHAEIKELLQVFDSFFILSHQIFMLFNP